MHNQINEFTCFPVNIKIIIIIIENSQNEGAQLDKTHLSKGANSPRFRVSGGKFNFELISVNGNNLSK